MKLYLTQWVVNTLNKKAQAEYHSCINQEQYRKWQAKWHKHLKQESYCITKPITATGLSIRQLRASHAALIKQMKTYENSVLKPMVDKLIELNATRTHS